jgi:hypothetical protein
MNASDGVLQRALVKILHEIIAGPPGSEAFLLNSGDPGLLRQLDSVTAAEASARPIAGKTTIAAHIDHLYFGFSLLNRWAAGEPNPFANADWNASWQRTSVTPEEWQALRDRLRHETAAWQTHVAGRHEWEDMGAAGAIASAAHTAYHLGSIRQILAAQGRQPVA